MVYPFHEISISVKIIFNFQKKILTWLCKSKPSENPFIIAKNQKLEFIISRHFKNLISPKPAWIGQWSLIPSRNLKKKLKFSPIFQIIFFLKKRFLRKFSKPGHGSLVLIASTVQVELSKLNFNYDDIRTNFLQVLTYYGFSRLWCYDDAKQN